MARNEHLREADEVSLPVPTGTKSGDPVVVGAFKGIAQTARRADGTASVWLEGSAYLNVTGTLAVGDPVYITSGGALNGTATGNTLFGYALQAKTSAAAVIPVRIAQV